MWNLRSMWTHRIITQDRSRDSPQGALEKGLRDFREKRIGLAKQVKRDFLVKAEPDLDLNCLLSVQSRRLSFSGDETPRLILLLHSG